MYFFLEEFDYDVLSRKTDIPYINYHGQPSTTKEMKKKSDIDTYNLALTNEINRRYKKNIEGKTPIFLDRSSLNIPYHPDKSKPNEIQMNDSTKANEVKKSRSNPTQSLSSKFSISSSEKNGVKSVDTSKYINSSTKPNLGNYPNVNFNNVKEIKSKPDTNNNVDIKSSNLFKQTPNPKKDSVNVANFNKSNKSTDLPSRLDLKKQIGKTSNSRFGLTVSEESTEKLVKDANDKKVENPKKILSGTNGKESENGDSKKKFNYLAYQERKKKDVLKNNTDRTFENSYNKKEIHENNNKKPLNKKLEYGPKKNSYSEISRDDSNEDSTTREESNDLIDKHFKHDFRSKKKKKPNNKFKEILDYGPTKIQKNNVLDTKTNIPHIQNLGKIEKPLSDHQMIDEKNGHSRRQINQNHQRKSNRKDGKTKKTILHLILKTNDESSDESGQKSIETKSKQKSRKKSAKNISKTSGSETKYNRVKAKSGSRKFVNNWQKGSDESASAESKSPNQTIEDSGQTFESEKRTKKRSSISRKRSVKNQNKSLCSSSKKCKMDKTKELSLSTQEDKPKKLTIVKYKVYGR